MADKKDEPKTDSWHESNYHRNGLLIAVVGALVLLLVFVLGIGIGNWRHERVVSYGPGFNMVGVPGRHMGGGYFGADGGVLNGSNRASGTVTAVNGSSFTLAGYGSTTNVQTNSSTQYEGGNSVKVNDTVTAFGTTSNGTLTATLVVINP